MLTRPRNWTLSTQLTAILVLAILVLQVLMISIDTLAISDNKRGRDRDLAPASFASVLPRIAHAPADQRDVLLIILGDPANHWDWGPEPRLRSTDTTDPEFAAQVLAWTERQRLGVDRVIIAERPGSRFGGGGPPKGVAMERSALFSLGAPARTALFEPEEARTPPWVEGPGDRPAGRPGGNARRPPETITVYTVAMRHAESGQWLTLYRLSGSPPINVSITKLGFTLAASLIVAVIGLMVGRRVMRPFRQLAMEADRIGRGDRSEPIEPRGPRDIREIVTAFNVMSQRVSQSVDYQIGLLRSLGHDLKGPMAAMRRLLAAVGPETTRAQIEDRLETVQGIIGSIMAFSRATMRDGEMERTDLVALVEAVGEEQLDLGHEVSLDAPDRLIVPCRFNATVRMVRNLVENAIKYGGSAEIRILETPEEAILRVEDRGPGLQEEDLEAVFAPFRRVATDTSGTGLGLAIVRTIAVDHGGSATLRNRRGGGLTAEVRLPLAQATAR